MKLTEFFAGVAAVCVLALAAWNLVPHKPKDAVVERRGDISRDAMWGGWTSANSPTIGMPAGGIAFEWTGDKVTGVMSCIGEQMVYLTNSGVYVTDQKCRTY